MVKKINVSDFLIVKRFEETSKKNKTSDVTRQMDLCCFVFIGVISTICPTGAWKKRRVIRKFKENGNEIMSVSTDTVFRH